MSHKVIDIVGLTKTYGAQVAVDNLDLTINKGEVFGLLGPNGAGKSTTMLMLMGLSEPDKGDITVCGINPVREPIEVKKKVGYLPEDVGYYDNLSGLENLIYTGRLNQVSQPDLKKKAKELLDRVGLAEQIHKKVGKYSRGMRQRLGLADVLVKNPEVIILDEPTLGIDPTGVKDFLDLIIELSKEEGITVLFSSHHLHQVQQVCDRIGLFVNGKLLAEGNVDALAKKLFTSGTFVIEARVTANLSGSNKSKSANVVLDLEKKLMELNEVNSVNRTEDQFDIACNSDITTEVADLVLQSGLGLNHLNKKEYGLDDIYFKYFEGGEKS